MSDLANLSDDQLVALYHGDYSKLSDGDLKALHAATTPDPVSVNNVARSAATGVPVVGGLLNQADAWTNAALSYPLNSLFDEKDQLTGTFSERHDKSLAMQEGSDAKFASQHPYIDTAAKIGGGVASMAPVVAAAPGVFGASGTFGSRVGAGAVSNAVIGGADSAARGEGPVSGAITGGVLGAAAPVVEAAASPFISSIMARINPEKFATRQVARGIAESGRSTDQLANDVTQAAAEGQGQFNLADAMGNAGHELLGAAARGPGEGRTAVVNALENRQAGQGRRIANTLSEGFGSRMTPDQIEAGMTASRDAQADAEYGAVRANANQPVDVTGAIDHIDNTLGPGADQMLANPGSATPNDSVEAVLQGFRNRLARVNPDDFASVQRIRGDMADAAQSAMQSGYGNRARLIRGAIGHLDTALENASSGFRQANANFAQSSRDIEAIGQGRDAALRGRTEDTIPAFNALQPRGQQAFRTGYVDPLIADAQKAAPGVNKARPLLNDALQDEAAAMAPGNALMQRRIGREQTMFEGRTTALGGSPTAKNLAHDSAMGVDPHLVMAAATGNWHGAIGRILQAGHNAATGNTPAVRKAVADILLRNGANLAPGQLDQMVSKTIAQIQFIQTMARSSTAAAATTTNANQKPPIFVTRNQ